jgi:hypothetical protein
VALACALGNPVVCLAGALPCGWMGGASLCRARRRTVEKRITAEVQLPAKALPYGKAVRHMTKTALTAEGLGARQKTRHMGKPLPCSFGEAHGCGFAR